MITDTTALFMARKISEYCKNTDCKQCVFREYWPEFQFSYCILSDEGRPEVWTLPMEKVANNGTDDQADGRNDQ